MVLALLSRGHPKGLHNGQRGGKSQGQWRTVRGWRGRKRWGKGGLGGAARGAPAGGEAGLLRRGPVDAAPVAGGGGIATVRHQHGNDLRVRFAAPGAVTE